MERSRLLGRNLPVFTLNVRRLLDYRSLCILYNILLLLSLRLQAFIEKIVCVDNYVLIQFLLLRFASIHFVNVYIKARFS